MLSSDTVVGAASAHLLYFALVGLPPPLVCYIVHKSMPEGAAGGHSLCCFCINFQENLLYGEGQQHLWCCMTGSACLCGSEPSFVFVLEYPG